MTRRILSLLLVSAYLALGSPHRLPSAWRSWRYSRAISSGRAEALNYVTLDREIFAFRNQLADLRIVDDLGHEFLEVRSQITPPASARQARRYSS